MGDGDGLGDLVPYWVFQRVWAALTFWWAVWAVKGGLRDAIIAAYM